MPNCKALTKAGTPCRAQAGESGTCYLHEDPERARLLGQSGGRKNRQRLPETPTGPLTAEDLRNIIAQTIRGVQAKTLPPRAASAIAQLCNSAKSLLLDVDLEDRVARLEQLAGQNRADADRSDGETNGREAAGEDATEQSVEEEASAFPDAGQPVEGGDDGVEDNGDGIADEEED
jgi:hypothetical protein